MNSEESASAEIESVVDSVRRGDHDSLDALFSNHRGYLRRVIDLRMDKEIRSRVDPSDIVQDAQIEAFRRVSEFARDPKIPVRLWMRQIAIDRLTMAHRKHVRAEARTVRREFALPEGSSMAIAMQLVAECASPSAHVARDEIARMVRSAVAELKEQDREIVLLQAFERLTSTESAQVLGIEPATARKRFGRALRRLKTLLIESGLGGSRT